MCTSIGVDPLASNKGFWAEMLGVGDFYYELGVQIIDVCLATRAQNGGIVGADELVEVLQRRRPAGAQPVCVDDILRAVDKLKGLGSGFNVMKAGSRTLVVSVPMALSDDHGALLSLAQEHGTPRGSLDAPLVAAHLRWGADRLARTLDMLVREGVLWVDDCAEGGARTRRYWAPSVCEDNIFGA